MIFIMFFEEIKFRKKKNKTKKNPNFARDMKFRFSLKYFLLSLLIFSIEVTIATILKDWYFVRAFVGDILVVVLVYALVSSFFDYRNKNKLLFFVFVFAVFVEILQYFKLAEKLGFPKGSPAYIIIGNYFSWEDISCYAIGCLSVFFINKIFRID